MRLNAAYGAPKLDKLSWHTHLVYLYLVEAHRATVAEPAPSFFHAEEEKAELPSRSMRLAMASWRESRNSTPIAFFR